MTEPWRAQLRSQGQPRTLRLSIMTNKKSLASVTLIVLMMVGLLSAMGRQWWCTCGEVVPWSWDIWTEHNSQHLLDPYFFSHVLHGVIFFWALLWIARWSKQRGIPISPQVRLLLAIAMEAIWEIFENSPLIINRYREATMALGYTGDSIANSIFDVLACAIGYFLASKLNWKVSVLILIVFELGMLLTIRDSLFLNIIMLIYPIDAIKQWQMPA